MSFAGDRLELQAHQHDPREPGATALRRHRPRRPPREPPPLGRPYTYRTYYQELSNGLLDIQGQTYGPATLANNEVAYTGTPPCSGNPISGNANCNGLFTNSQIPGPFARMQNGLREVSRKGAVLG